MPALNECSCVNDDSSRPIDQRRLMQAEQQRRRADRHEFGHRARIGGGQGQGLEQAQLGAIGKLKSESRAGHEPQIVGQALSHLGLVVAS